MGEKSDQIEQHIYEKRSELSQNINELQSKVRHAVDWRAQFEERPFLMMGLAFCGGVLLSTAIRRSRNWRYSRRRSTNGRASEWSERAAEAWDSVKGAVLSVGAKKLTDYLTEILPGFREHYRPSQREQRRLGYEAEERRGYGGSSWRGSMNEAETRYARQSS